MNWKQMLAVAVLSASTLGAVATSHATATPSAGAKNGGHGHFMRHRMMDMNQLGLSASQKTKAQAIMKDSRARGDKIRNDKSLSEAQKMERMKANRKATKARMNAILNSDQRKKLATMRAQRHQMHAGKTHPFMQNGKPLGHGKPANR